LARLGEWLRARPVAAGTAGIALAVGVALVAMRLSTTTTTTTAPAVAVVEDVDELIEIELPGLEEAWESDSIVFDLELDEELDELFATAEPNEDEPTEVDFGVAPEFDTFLDELTEEELELVDESFEVDKAS
jgi:hypothetical protein